MESNLRDFVAVAMAKKALGCPSEDWVALADAALEAVNKYEHRPPDAPNGYVIEHTVE